MKKFNSGIGERLTGRHKYSFKFCGNVKGKTILDVGSSYGWFEKFAVEAECKSVLGIEPEENLFYAAQKEVPKAIFKKGSALKIPAKDNFFDLVVMFDVIEHIPRKTESKALKEIKRVLRPGGTFAMSTSLNFWFTNIMDPIWYFGHRHYNEKQLRNLLGKEGFKVKKVEYRGGWGEMASAILLYPFKWIFHCEVPFKKYLEQKRDEEYLVNKKGFMTIYLKATK
ncbi:class I SAM-dependent methyltransferase [Candidatus Microgenomates bacterium]|jgi:ubiquinone/menaquinone biosynthesis C-methylase UbiE|nr:MAG: class I SAM-dependent methyltransferase [Candidatus Microgenomates bacterium]